MTQNHLSIRCFFIELCGKIEAILVYYCECKKKHSEGLALLGTILLMV